MDNSEIVLTNFGEGLTKENKPLHRQLISKRLIEKYGCEQKDISFSNPADDKRTDDIVSYLDVAKKIEYTTGVEYKIDYRAALTGNMVFELITYIPEVNFPNVTDKFCSTFNQPQTHQTILDLIDNIGNIKEAQVSRHLDTKDDDCVLSYVIADPERALEHFLIKGNVLSKFVKDNYRTHPFIVTRTQNGTKKWCTVSMAVRIKEIREIGWHSKV
jgi:hypothetical protein